MRATYSIHRRISFVLQAVLCVELLVALATQKWLTSFVTAGIILVTLIPLLLWRRFRVQIPPQFHLLAIAFIFASLFLGEVRDYYTRYWWWDTALHTISGLILGIIGFLLVHILNEIDNIGVHMKPGFVAFFAFMFAVGAGAIWEIFEFTMDSLFGMNMQKPMLDDPSGLTDTMFDLIADTVGAIVMCLFGYFQLKKPGRMSFLEEWIDDFVMRNPHMFKGAREKSRD